MKLPLMVPTSRKNIDAVAVSPRPTVIRGWLACRAGAKDIIRLSE